MGWGNCGTDSKGRPIGYAFEAVCDHPGCGEFIDRGLAFACGGMHGQNIFDCEGYFCTKHLSYVGLPDKKGSIQICPECYKRMILDDGMNIIGVIDCGTRCLFEQEAPIPS